MSSSKYETGQTGAQAATHPSYPDSRASSRGPTQYAPKATCEQGAPSAQTSRQRDLHDAAYARAVPSARAIRVPPPNRKNPSLRVRTRHSTKMPSRSNRHNIPRRRTPNRAGTPTQLTLNRTLHKRRPRSRTANRINPGDKRLLQPQTQRLLHTPQRIAPPGSKPPVLYANSVGDRGSLKELAVPSRSFRGCPGVSGSLSAGTRLHAPSLDAVSAPTSSARLDARRLRALGMGLLCLPL